MDDESETPVSLEAHRKKLDKEKKRRTNGEAPAEPSSTPPSGGIDFSILKFGEKGPHKNIRNVRAILKNHPAFADAFAYDMLRQDIVIDKETPVGNPGPVTDHTILLLTEWMQENGFNVASAIVAEGMKAEAMAHPFHPVQRYLESLEWEGTERISTWLSAYAGVKDSEYVRAVGRKWLIAAVARAMRPGCQSDCMLVFEGPQGRRKSTLLSILGGEWFSDSLSAVGTKDASMEATRWWIIEISELQALSKAETSLIKSFISRRHERYRMPYDRVVSDIPRSCIFAGTVNPTESYLKDVTGNRRFWPVTVDGVVNLESLAKDRDQLFAEAMHAWRNGDCWWLSENEGDAAEDEQDARRDVDAWEPTIEAFIASKKETTMAELLGTCLQIEKNKWGRPEQTRVGNIMTALGWKRMRCTPETADVMPDGTKKREYVYKRPAAIVRGGNPANAPKTP